MSCRACSLKVSQQQWEFSRRQAKIFERRSPSNFKSNTLTTQKCKKAVIKRQERGTTFFSFFFFLPLRTGLHISTMPLLNSEHTAWQNTGRQGKKCSNNSVHLTCMKLYKMTTTIIHTYITYLKRPPHTIS